MINPDYQKYNGPNKLKMDIMLMLVSTNAIATMIDIKGNMIKPE
jgi:hypothetical protein